MSGNILQAEHVSKSSVLSWFLTSAEYQLSIITTESFEIVFCGETHSVLLTVSEQRPVLISDLADSVINTFHAKLKGSLSSSQCTQLMYCCDMLLTFLTLWEQTAEKQQNSWPINTSECKRMRISLCFCLPYAKIWREQGLSQCFISKNTCIPTSEPHIC